MGERKFKLWAIDTYARVDKIRPGKIRPEIVGLPNNFLELEPLTEETVAKFKAQRRY